jgi:hypothetical protein
VRLEQRIALHAAVAEHTDNPQIACRRRGRGKQQQTEQP